MNDIAAGNSLQINAGSLTNIGSLMAAGTSATINVSGPVVNEAQTLNAYWHSHWVQETGDFSPDRRHDVWACGSAAECTALYGSAYTRVGGSIDPPTPVGNIAATIQAPNLTITSNGQIQNVGNIVGTSVTLTGQRLINGITTANTYTPRVNAASQVISLSPLDLPGLNLANPHAAGSTLPTAITALMPQVYLPQNWSALSAGGNIQGANVTLNFDQNGQGSILNTGTIAASNTLTVNTQSLTNQANQVDVGNIWSKVKGGYVDTTGTQVQPGGFMSAANMDLNVQTLQQIGGALQQLNADGSINAAGTQQMLAALQQQLGGNFT